ncbi:MAG: hypothetical protein GF392_01075 [Candidatus Omnitrophica bacterium]|nr:hypothetical protein [Candidatus Omnitrophota bacterium]
MSRAVILFTIICIICPASISAEPPVKVCVSIRGNTGLEQEVRKVMEDRFRSFPLVEVTSSSRKSHVYIDLALVEQDPIRFYALGASISYHIKDEFYSRPVSDVAQFGEERMEEVCTFLAEEIDKGFIEPLRNRATR